MNQKDLLNTILKKSYTKSDALRRLRLLREYLEKKLFSGTEITLSDFLSNQNISEQDQKIMSSWNKSTYESITQENLYNFLNTLSEKIKNYPTIIIYLPKQPEDKDYEKIGSWFQKNLSPNTLIDIQLDEEKIGGCAFVKNGVMSDYSLKYYLKKNKEQILNLISNYATKEKVKNIH